MSENNFLSEEERKVIEQTRDDFEDKKRQQEAALEAISKGESDLEEYETVTLGELEMTVKAWLPGEVEDTIQQAHDIAQRGDEMEVRRSMETMITALDEMTESDVYDRGFWRMYYRKWGQVGLITAVETIFDPAMDKTEAKAEGVKSFRKKQQGR